MFGHERSLDKGGNYLVVNTGSDVWNYQVRDLAYAIQDVLPGVKVSVNKDAQPDKRSYRVSFDLYKSLAPDFQPEYDLTSTIKDLAGGLKDIDFKDKNFRNSHLMRLHVVNELLATGILDESLRVIR